MSDPGIESATAVRPIRFYRTDYRVKTPAMRSPEYVQMSTAAAITLGLVDGRMHRTGCRQDAIWRKSAARWLAKS